MSKKNLSYLVIIALLFILNLIMAGDGGKVLIGEPVTADSILSLSDLYYFPEPYVNKTVRIEGKIADIYQDSRCSFLLKDDDGGEICVQCSGCGYSLSKDDIGRKCITQGIIMKYNMHKLMNSVGSEEFGFSTKSTVTLHDGNSRYYLDSQGIILE
jgi:hypothetical protein